jgi:hypothetical protein
VVVAAGATIGGLYLAGAFGHEPPRQTLRHVELAPLPPGLRRLTSGAPGHADGEAPSVEEMLRGAKVAFVGTVADIGGSEPVALGHGLAFPTRRVRFAVERVFRGPRVDTIDVADYTWEGNMFKATVGDRFLILAERRQLGERRVRRLVPLGAYSDGAFRITDRGAVNRWGHSVDPDRVAARYCTRAETGSVSSRSPSC